MICTVIDDPALIYLIGGTVGADTPKDLLANLTKLSRIVVLKSIENICCLKVYDIRAGLN